MWAVSGDLASDLRGLMQRGFGRSVVLSASDQGAATRPGGDSRQRFVPLDETAGGNPGKSGLFSFAASSLLARPQQNRTLVEHAQSPHCSLQAPIH